MNREILFKGFSEDPEENEKIELNGKVIKGKWVEGYLVEYTYQDTVYINGTSPKESYIFPMDERSELKSLEKRIKVISKTVSQYTGLKDKNGKRIFENDNVKYDNKFIKEVGTILYNDDNASFQIKGIPSSSMKHNDRLVIIGTIFDKEEVCDG